jgi:hypothetical protein
LDDDQDSITDTVQAHPPAPAPTNPFDTLFSPDIFGTTDSSPGVSSPMLKIKQQSAVKRHISLSAHQPRNLFGELTSFPFAKKLKTNPPSSDSEQEDEVQILLPPISTKVAKPDSAKSAYHDPAAHPHGYDSDELETPTRTPWHLNDEALTVFSSSKITKLARLKSFAYVPLFESIQVFPDGIFTHKRFTENDIRALSPIHIRWSFLGIFVLPSDLALYDPRSTSLHKQQYLPAYYFAPSLISPAWVTEVFPHIGPANSKLGHQAGEAANTLIQAAITLSTNYKETPFAPNFNVKWLQEDSVRRPFESMILRSGLMLNREDHKSLYEAITPFTFISSVPNLGTKIPMNGFTMDNMSDILVNMVFITSLILGNTDFYPEFPSGFSPYLLRGIFPGNIMWFREILSNHLAKQAWTKLQLSKPEHAQKLSGAFLIHVGLLMDILFDWILASSRSKLCHPATTQKVGDTQTRCTLLLDRKAINGQSILPDIIQWRETVLRLWSPAGINAPPDNVNLFPCMIESLPSYLFVQPPIQHSRTSSAPNELKITPEPQRAGQHQSSTTVQSKKSDTETKLNKYHMPHQRSQKASIPLFQLTEFSKHQTPDPLTTGKIIHLIKKANNGTIC